MSRRNKSRAQKAIETEIVETLTTDKPVVERTGLFNFGSLNVHVVQEIVLGETVQGLPFTLEDFELRMFTNNIFFIERKLGESVVGRIYQLTEDQLKSLDEYMTDKYKREDVEQGTEKFQTYLLKEPVD